MEASALCCGRRGIVLFAPGDTEIEIALSEEPRLRSMQVTWTWCSCQLTGILVFPAVCITLFECQSVCFLCVLLKSSSSTFKEVEKENSSVHSEAFSPHGLGKTVGDKKNHFTTCLILPRVSRKFTTGCLVTPCLLWGGKLSSLPFGNLKWACDSLAAIEKSLRFCNCETVIIFFPWFT